jgi:hypothetical protein
VVGGGRSAGARSALRNATLHDSNTPVIVRQSCYNPRMAAPTERTLKKLRGEGWLAEVVERWIPYARVRKDLFGWIDIIAIRDGDTLAVQCTSKSNMAARVKKIRESDTIAPVRAAGWNVWVVGWAKKDGRWEPTVRNLTEP